MQPLSSKELILQGIDMPELLRALTERCHLLAVEERERRSTYWDTFDWRVWNAQGTLIERLALPDAQTMTSATKKKSQQSRRELAWCHRSGQRRQLGWLPGNRRPGLAATLPDQLCDLAPILSMRRLLPMLHLHQRSRHFRVLDECEKTVVRLQLIEATACRDSSSPSQPLAARLRITPIRGYDGEEAEVLRFLTNEFRLAAAQESLFQAGLEAIGRRAGDYSSKVKLKLQRDLGALDATGIIYRALFDAMLINEPGMRADLDSEFLHDFRVAVRRTRSALSQIKDVFAEDALEHFKHQFRWLGQITGPTRDLDVYLLKMPSYRADLPTEARQHLEPLERFLIARQAAQQKKLVRHLKSARYRDLLEAWRSQLESPAPGPAAELPAIDVASARIWKLYRRMVKNGRAIDDQTSAEALHEVRIMGKKLRYLMEFFRSLYAKKEIDAAISELKRLQDLLGDFNDYEVQEAALGQFAEALSDQLAAAGQDTTQPMLAMGRLQAHLDDARRRERSHFQERFGRFASASNRLRFKALFSDL